jgi:diguanylate cyclase (GGDEF)-like protein
MRGLVILVALLWCLPMTAATAGDVGLTAQEKAWLAAHPGPLRVHNESDWRPYNFTEDGRPAGFSIDYMRLVAKKAGLPITFVSGPSWAEFMEMIRHGDLDVMLNIASTRERREFLSFTEPYYITSVGLYVRPGTEDIADLKDMTGRRLAYPADFFFDEFLARFYPDILRTPFPSAPASFHAVADGRADAAMDVPGVARAIMARDNLDLRYAGKVSDPRFITTFYMAVRRGEEVLRDILQKGMDAVTTEEIRALDERWNLRETGTAAPLFSPEDIAYLQGLGSLRTCVDPDRLPLEGIDRTGAHTGVAGELAGLLGEALTVPLVAVPLAGSDDSLALARSGGCDLVLLGEPEAEVSGTLALAFTRPWLYGDLVVATRDDQIYLADPRQLSGQTIGVTRGETTGTLLRAARPDLALRPVDSLEEGLRQVADGHLYGLAGNVATLSRALQLHPVRGVKISGPLGIRQPFAVGVRADRPRLLRVVGTALDSIGQEQVDDVYRRWLSVAYVDRVDYARLWQGLAVVLVLAAYAAVRYRKNLRVTAALRAAHAEAAAANQALAGKNEELARMARHDPLTGLGNRLRLDEALKREMCRFTRYGTPFSVILLDVDHFKKINDRHGHQVGDGVLVRLAGVLREITRGSDLAGRWGGEEFLVLCPSTDLDGACHLAEHLRRAIAETTDDGLPAITASLGVAMVGTGDGEDRLLSRADTALYAAKQAGRNRVMRQADQA